MKCYAFMRGGRIYTLKPCTDPAYRKTPFKRIGFCDGTRCGFFKTKRDFEQFVESQPDDPPRSFAPHALASYKAEAWSTFEGMQILRRLAESQQKRTP